MPKKVNTANLLGADLMAGNQEALKTNYIIEQSRSSLKPSIDMATVYTFQCPHHESNAEPTSQQRASSKISRITVPTVHDAKVKNSVEESNQQVPNPFLITIPVDSIYDESPANADAPTCRSNVPLKSLAQAENEALYICTEDI